MPRKSVLKKMTEAERGAHMRNQWAVARARRRKRAAEAAIPVLAQYHELLAKQYMASLYPSRGVQR